MKMLHVGLIYAILGSTTWFILRLKKYNKYIYIYNDIFYFKFINVASLVNSQYLAYKR